MEEHQAEPVITHHRPNYVMVFVALCVLTGLELGVTAFIGGLPKAWFLLTMTFIKVMLVVLYFMHLKDDNPWYRVVFFVPFLLVLPLMLVAVTQ